ncbi:uncharacterized protein LOC135056314 isoform X2 [Pseudophryne corroboree]|uniref:uncharacterized protein LOC135056314 isoform X2 n=1 Tax=Pseudophryne corroboree TaxID=495146 RepID=UPI003081E10C
MKGYLGLLTAYMIINGAFASTSSTIQGNTGVSVESVTHAGGTMDVTTASNIIGTLSPAAKTLPLVATTIGEHHSQGITKNDLSKLIIRYNSLHNNTMHITCFLENGPLPIQYELILGDRKVQEITVRNKEPANFTILMTPGTNVQVKCKARSSSGGEVCSDIVSQSVDDDLSKLIIRYNSLHNNTMHITCFLENGPLPIRYELILGDRKVQEITVHNKEPANFTILMTPGTNVQVKCKARSSSGVEVCSDIVSQSVDDDTPKVEDEEDDGDKDSGPKHLIALHYILTSVDPQVQKRNTLLLCICGPTILLVLVFVILLTYLRNRREHHVEV